MKARVEYKILLLTYKALKYEKPKYLRDNINLFEPDMSVTVRHAGERHRLFEPRTTSKLEDRAFKYCAPRLYNKLPTSMKNINDEIVFKKRLKALLFSRSYDTESETIKDPYKL